MHEFRVIKFQGSVFTPDLVISNYLKFMHTVGELQGEALQGNPTVLPMPQDAPAEIPRFHFVSQDGKWTLTISLARTDLIFFDPSDVSTTGQAGMDAEIFSKKCGNFFGSYKEKLDLRVQRLAFVTDRIAPDDHASVSITQNFCRPDKIRRGKPFHNVHRFEIHSLKKYDWGDYHLNSWVRIKAADIMTDKTQPCLFVQNDLNTLSLEEDPSQDFSGKAIDEFFLGINEHLQDILKKYEFA
jgi:hypothetical protein